MIEIKKEMKIVEVFWTAPEKDTAGRTCEDEDDNRHDCVEQCRDIYSRRSDRDDCEELPIRQIEVLADLHELLEDP